MCHRDRYFELVDTGGIGFDDPDNLTGKIDEQITAGIDSANVVLFVVDTRSGLIAAGPGSGPPAALRRRAGDLRGQQDRRRTRWTARPTSSTGWAAAS